jgi:hypothetical protein
MTDHHRHHPRPGRYSDRRPGAAHHQVARQPGVARETGAAYDAGEVGPSLRDAVGAAATWLQRVLDLAVDGRVEGGELGALLDLLPALDRGHAAAVALTDTALQGSLPERKAGINYDTLLAMQTRATYTERGRLQRLAQLLRKTPHLRAAYHHGLHRHRPAAHHRHRSQGPQGRRVGGLRRLLRRHRQARPARTRPAHRPRPHRDRPAASRPRPTPRDPHRRAVLPPPATLPRRLRGRTLRLRRRLVRLPRRRHRHRRRPTHHRQPGPGKRQRPDRRRP